MIETLVTQKVSIVLHPIMSDIVTKQRIQKAAHDLVMQYGIRSVSMDDIASNLGMSKKTIYLYYKDKDELIDSVVEEVIHSNQCQCNNDRDNADNAVHEIFQVMEMMTEMFKTMNPSILFDMQKYHPVAYQRFQKHRNDYLYNVCRQNLERGIEEGLYRPEINIEIMARYRVETMLTSFNPEFQRNVTRCSERGSIDDKASRKTSRKFLFGHCCTQWFKGILFEDLFQSHASNGIIIFCEKPHRNRIPFL